MKLPRNLGGRDLAKALRKTSREEISAHLFG